MLISSIINKKISRILLTRQKNQLHSSERNIDCYYKNHQLIFNFVFLVMKASKVNKSIPIQYRNYWARSHICNETMLHICHIVYSSDVIFRGWQFQFLRVKLCHILHKMLLDGNLKVPRIQRFYKKYPS